MGQVLRPEPGPVVVHPDPARPAHGRHLDADRRRGRGVAERIVDEDRDELPEAGRIAGRGHRLGIHFDPYARPFRGGLQAVGGVEGDRGEVRRLQRELDDPGVGPGQQEEVIHERPHAVHFGLDVLERIAHLGDRQGRVAAQVLHGPTDDGQRRPKLVRSVGGELALATHRLADRHERPVGVDPTQGERGQQDRESTDQEDRERGSSTSEPRPSGPRRPG